MTLENKTYQIGDLFTTQRSGVTGAISEIVPVNDRTTRVKLVMDNGDYRWTTVTIKQYNNDLSQVAKLAHQPNKRKKEKEN